MGVCVCERASDEGRETEIKESKTVRDRAKDSERKGTREKVRKRDSKRH